MKTGYKSPRTMGGKRKLPKLYKRIKIKRMSEAQRVKEEGRA